jgi:CheY-like chemotaxis protein
LSGASQKTFAKPAPLFQSPGMVQPLAIVLNDRVVIGAQLEQKLEALDYRVKVSDNPAALAVLAQEHKPLVVLMDVSKGEHLEAASALFQHPDTRHVPVLGFAPEISADLESRAKSAGIGQVVTDSAVLQHLKPLLDQALQVE